jgi:uncharacterized protein YoxC
MDTHLDGLERTQAKFHEAFNNRMEDVEDEVQVLKCDMEHLENRMGEMKRDMMDVEASINNAHTRIEKVEDHVDGFLQALRSNVRVVLSSSLVVLKEAQRVESNLCLMIEGWFGKLEWCNTIINRKFIHLDKELEKDIALVREKIKAKFGEFSDQFMEATETEEAC